MKLTFISIVMVGLIIIGCAKATSPITVDPGDSQDLLTITNIYPTVGVPYDMIITDTHIFLAEDQAGFSVFDRSANVLASRVTTRTETTNLENARQLGYSEHHNYLYVYDRFGSPAGIYVYDVQDIYDIPPHAIAQMTGATGNIHQLYTRDVEDGNIEVAISYSNSVFRHGISTIPTILTHGTNEYQMPNAVTNFHIVGQYAYIAGAQRGLYIFDLESGSVISELNMTGEALDVRVKGDYAYIVAKQEGLLVADVSDVNNPQWLEESSKSTVGWAQSIGVEGDYLVVGSGGGGVYLYDIGENPAEPKFLDRLTSSAVDYVLLVAIRNSKVFVAGRYQGITEVDINR